MYFSLNTEKMFDKPDFGCASSLLYCIVEKKDAGIHNHTKYGLKNPWILLITLLWLWVLGYAKQTKKYGLRKMFLLREAISKL